MTEGTETDRECALIVGATSSLAQAICHELARRDYRLTLCARDEAELALLAADLSARYLAQCRLIPGDVLEPGFSPELFIDRAGNFDIAIVTLGDMGAEELANLENIAYTAHINYILPAQLSAVIAQRFADKRRGTLAVISSVAGDRGRQSNYAYGAAKAALTTFASGLRNRFSKEGVHVVTIKPGFIDTPMTWGMQSRLIASREEVARHILKSILRKKNVVYVPSFWRWIMLIIRHIPERIFKKLSL